MSEYLVLLDTDKIKQYIYSTGTLKSIRGASSILAELNGRQAVEGRVSACSGEYIFAGGGQVMAEFASDSQADNFICAEQAQYASFNASITAIKEEYNGDFNNTVKKAQTKLKRAKEERAYGKGFPSSPFFKTCELCGVDSASITKYEKFVCTACEMKVDRGEKIRGNPARSPVYARFLNFMKGHPAYEEWKDARFTDGISELGEISKPKNYLGLICADGNRMGERLLERTSKTEYQELSKAIEKGLEESIFESLREHIPKPLKGRIPFEFVIFGGDDLILLTPAEKAIPIALEMLKKFAEKTRNLADGEENLTLSAGVAIAHSKFPMLLFTGFAEDLLESSKKLNKEKWYGAEAHSQREEISTIDYLVITTPSVNPVAVIRGKDLTYTMGGSTHRLTQRPFTLEKANKIASLVKDIKKSKLSRSRLYSIINALHKGKSQSILSILSLISRAKEQEGESIKKLFCQLKNESLLFPNGGDAFPWDTLGGFAYDTPFLDILEIYDFIEE